MSVWTDFALDQPDGSVDDGPAVIQDIQNNQHAMWNFAMMGMAKDMLFSVSGGTAEQPTNVFFSNGTNILRAAITWGTTGGANGNFSSIAWQVSQDDGANYVPLVTQTFTYDGSGNLTATTGAGGMTAWLAYLLGKVKALATRVTAIETLLATYGDMALQDASAVAMTGGTAKGIVIGGTGANEAQLGTFKATRDKVVDLGSGTPANTFTIDWNAGGVFLCAPGANFTIASTNAPPNGFAQKVVLEITNGAGRTVTLPTDWHWSADTPPTFSSGVDLVTVYYRGHATTPTARLMLSSGGF